MKTIQILSLKLENFKCHKALELTFDGKSRTIYGDNAAGKTSVYDAFHWLLFGKTANGSADNELLKPTGEDGKVTDHEAITAVEAVLLVTEATGIAAAASSRPTGDGSAAASSRHTGAVANIDRISVAFAQDDTKTVTLRRELQEVWTSRRGSSEQVYDGNTCNYFIDGVPMKKGEFERQVHELVDETAFRLLTNVYYFSSDLPWKDRRAVLSEIAGCPSDASIMAGDPRFLNLIGEIGGKTVDEFKKMLLERKKGLTADRNTIPARISECEGTVQTLSGIDFDAEREQLSLEEATVRSLQEKLNSLKNGTEADKLNAEIKVIQAAISELNTDNEAHRAMQKTGLPDTDRLQADYRAACDACTRAQKVADYNRHALERTEQQISELRKEWETVNALHFSEDTCPTCGQRMPQEYIRAARSRFESEQAIRLTEIERSAEAAKQSKTDTEAALAEAESDFTMWSKREADAKRVLAAAVEERSAFAVSDMDGYAEQLAALQERMNAAQTELSAVMASKKTAISKAEAALADARLRAKQCAEALGQQGALDYMAERLSALKEQQQRTAAMLSELDNKLYSLEQFTAYKAEQIEKNVNSHFRITEFKLFREQVNGGLEECCEATQDGIVYGGLNGTAKVNVGLDIIRTLSEHYGVQVPIFIDNAESFVKLEDAGTQMIRLVVSAQDKSLRME